MFFSTITAVCVAKLHSNCLQFVHVVSFVFHFFIFMFSTNCPTITAVRRETTSTFQTAANSHVKIAKCTIPHAINRLCPIMDMHFSTCRRERE